MKLNFRLIYPTQKETLLYLKNYRNYYGLSYFYKVYPNLKNKTDIEIAQFFADNKEVILKKMEKRKKLIERKWNESSRRFFIDIEKLTNFKWRKKYYCYLSPLDKGEYDIIKKNVIIVFAFIHLNYLNRVIAEELYHLHYWDYLENEFGLDVERMWGNKKYWRLSEAIAMLVLKEIGFDFKIEYWDKEVNKLYWKLEPSWRNRKNFKEFIEKSLKI